MYPVADTDSRLVCRGRTSRVLFSRFELAVEPSSGQIIALRHGEQVRGCPSLYSSCSDGCEDGVRSNISGPNSSVSRCRNAAAAVCTAAACFYF